MTGTYVSVRRDQQTILPLDRCLSCVRLWFGMIAPFKRIRIDYRWERMFCQYLFSGAAPCA